MSTSSFDSSTSRFHSVISIIVFGVALFISGCSDADLQSSGCLPTKTDDVSRCLKLEVSLMPPDQRLLAASAMADCDPMIAGKSDAKFAECSKSYKTFSLVYSGSVSQSPFRDRLHLLHLKLSRASIQRETVKLAVGSGDYKKYADDLNETVKSASATYSELRSAFYE